MFHSEFLWHNSLDLFQRFCIFVIILSKHKLSTASCQSLSRSTQGVLGLTIFQLIIFISLSSLRIHGHARQHEAWGGRSLGAGFTAHILACGASLLPWQQLVAAAATVATVMLCCCCCCSCPGWPCKFAAFGACTSAISPHAKLTRGAGSWLLTTYIYAQACARINRSWVLGFIDCWCWPCCCCCRCCCPAPTSCRCPRPCSDTEIHKQINVLAVHNGGIVGDRVTCLYV